jgi:glucan 1,3-beta-glucosidase
MRAFSVLSSCLLIASSLVGSSRAAPYDAEEWVQYDKRATTQVIPHFANRTSKVVRGVNLGGWFVLEAWMNPSFFTSDLTAKGAIDQWTFMTAVNNNTRALSLLQTHWSTWVNESDFTAIAAAGLNTVRIPVPHWTFNGSSTEPYLAGAELKYIQQAVTWAAKHNLDVLLDLHTAPGSQNGFDNSGRMGNATFESINPTVNAARMYSALQSMVNLFINTNTYSGAVKAIEILNEPACYLLDPNYVIGVYSSAYKAIRATVKSTAPVYPTIIMHDCFIAPLSGIYAALDSLALTSGSYAVDTHRYTAFYPVAQQLGNNNTAHINYICGMQPEIVGAYSKFPMIVGEWSLAVACDNCSYATMAQSVASQNNPTNISFYRQFFEAQTTTYEMGGGWIFWNWKTETAATWSYQTGLAQGWIPQNPTTRVFKQVNNCPTTTMTSSVTFGTTSNSTTTANKSVVATSGKTTTTSSAKVSTSTGKTTTSKQKVPTKVATLAKFNDLSFKLLSPNTNVTINNMGTTTGVLQKLIPPITPLQQFNINSTYFPYLAKSTFGKGIWH